MYGQQTAVMGSVSGAALGSANGHAQPVPAPTQELPAAMERLQQTVEGVLYQIDGLDNRLTGVVARSHGPASDEKGQLKAAMNTSMGGQLDALNERLRQANSRLAGLLDRLEF